MSAITAPQALDNVSQGQLATIAKRDELDAAIAARDAAIVEALELGVSQIAIAAAANLSQATVSRLDRNRKAGLAVAL